jgi:predicted metal-dependent phosphoesterase TrpH
VGKADLHIHTRVSDGMATVSQVLEYIEHRTALDVVAITDHEDAGGGLLARDLAAKRGYRFEVIVGAEITTLQGHVLGLFLERTPPSFRRVESTLEMIHDQGGIAIAPHPLSWLTRSLSSRTMDRLAAQDGPRFDAVELANPSPAATRTRGRAMRANQERWRLPDVGGSDAHHLHHIGSAWTNFPGRTAADLREAIRTGATSGEMGPYAGLREIGLRRVALGLAWGYSATPRKMMRRRA